MLGHIESITRTVGTDGIYMSEDIADAYSEMTDSTRHLLRVRNDDRKEHRVKPDPETHPLAEFDRKEQATHRCPDTAIRTTGGN